MAWLVSHVAGPVAGECSLLRRVFLAAVDGQGRGGDPARVPEPGDFDAEPAGPDGLGLVGVTEAPQPGAGGVGHGGEDDLGVGGGDLRHLVEDHDGVRREVGAVEREAGDGHGRDAGVAEFVDGLVGGRQADDGQAGVVGGDDGGVHGGGLAESGRRDQRAQRRSARAQRSHGGGLIGTEARGFSGDGPFDDELVDAIDSPGDEPVEVVEDGVFGQEMVDGGVLRRAAAGSVHEEHRLLGVEKGGGEPLDGGDVETAAAEGRHLLDDVGFPEPGPAGAQAALRDR